MEFKKILMTTNVPASYRVNFFNEFGKYVDLTVIFEKSSSTERDPLWNSNVFSNFKGIILSGIKFSVDSAFSPSIIKYIINNKYDKIIVCNPLTPTGIFLVTMLRLLRMNFIIEIDGAFYNPNQKYLNMVRKFIYKNADYCLSTSSINDLYFEKLGVETSKIIRYPFSSIYDSEIVNKPLNKIEKIELKKSLKIIEDKIVLAVGQFIERKGFDILIKAMSSFNNTYGLYIIGGNDSNFYKESLEKADFKNIHFIPYMNKSDLSKYYKLADIFVMPTREDIWGLVINEAIANGLPIITSNMCLSGITLVKPNVNGNIFQVDDISGLEKQIVNIFNEDLKHYSEESIKIAHAFTIEKMVSKHMEILELP